MDFGAFYARRSLRIFPAFYSYWLGLTILLVIAKKPINWPHSASAFLYFSNYFHAWHGDPNDGFSHKWSLAIEEQFYVLWPMALYWLYKRKARIHLWLTAAIVADAAYRVMLVYTTSVGHGWIYAAFDTRVDALLVGCLLAVLLVEGRLANLSRFVCSSPLIPLVTVVLIWLAAGATNPGAAEYRDVFGLALTPP